MRAVNEFFAAVTADPAKCERLCQLRRLDEESYIAGLLKMAADSGFSFTELEYKEEVCRNIAALHQAGGVEHGAASDSRLGANCRCEWPTH